ncbi:hypothetical protein [Thermoactinospora rubra]|uniref:hypothetical protein n=1 Tax=Thermoactinospora rubra TaxID=1088767 RepID=UPI00197D3264|nr:hypothetical protein [Thermoactinospora rubra]
MRFTGWLREQCAQDWEAVAGHPFAGHPQGRGRHAALPDAGLPVRRLLHRPAGGRRGLRRLLRGELDRVGPAHRDDVLAVFRRAVALERRFFDMAMEA